MPVNNNIRPKDDLGNFSSYEQKYSSLKTKLKVILYENELFQDELRKVQRELLDIYRDKEALLEKVLQFEDIGSSSSDSESLSSDNECDPKLIENELQVIVQSTINSNNKLQQKTNPSKNATAAKKANQTKTGNNTGGPKPKANSGPTKKAASTSNSKPSTNGVAKAEKKPSVKVENKKGSTKAESVTKPKAASRARTKVNANQNGNKVTPITTSTITTSASTVIAPTMNSIIPTMTPVSMSMTEIHQSQQQQHPHQHQQHSTNQEQVSLHFQLQQQQKITQHASPQTHPDTSHSYQCIPQQVATYPGYHIAAAPGHIQTQTHVQLVQLHPHSQTGHRLMATTPTNMISVPPIVHAQQPNIQQQQQVQQQQLQQQSSGQEHHQITHHQQLQQLQHPQQQQQQQQQHQHQLQHPRQPQQSQHQQTQPQQQQQQQQQHQQQQHQPQQHQQQQHQQQQQQQQHQHALMAEQLSAEELEQYLEARRMEQASLLLPDWESSVPSEIFSTDSGIKFMAED